MKLGIMQPYFFPYIGYFDLINSTDKWIVFDTAQYIRHGWVNRNRILHPSQGWQYIIAPTQKHAREAPILDVQLSDSPDWKNRVLGQLMHYRKQAPFYDETAALVKDCLSTDERSLSRLNASILAKVCAHIGVVFDYSMFSEMDLKLGPVEGPGDWALRISAALGADEYINPPGGAGLFDPEAFKMNGINLSIRKLCELDYPCAKYKFVPGLSIVDVLMWNSTERVKEYLDAQL